MNAVLKRFTLAMLSGLLVLSLASCIGDDKQEMPDTQETESATKSVLETEGTSPVSTDTLATADGSPIELPVVP